MFCRLLVFGITQLENKYVGVNISFIYSDLRAQSTKSKFYREVLKKFFNISWMLAVFLSSPTIIHQFFLRLLKTYKLKKSTPLFEWLFTFFLIRKQMKIGEWLVQTLYFHCSDEKPTNFHLKHKLWVFIDQTRLATTGNTFT